MGAGAIPDEFVCPISGDVMREPVWLSTGVAVDKVFGEWYLQAGFTKCPVSGDTIKSRRLVPVPNMKEYIAKWGSRVGFDLDVVPTEETKTHAIIQAMERVEKAGTTMHPSSLPRATAAEILEAWAKSGLDEPVTATDGSARGFGDDFREDRNSTEDGDMAPPVSDELSMTLKAYAAANAVPAPDSHDGESSASSEGIQPSPVFDQSPMRAANSEVPRGDSDTAGLMGKIFSTKESARQLPPEAQLAKERSLDAPKSHALDLPRQSRDSTRMGGAGVGTLGLAADDLERYSSGDTSLPSSGRSSFSYSSQDGADGSPSREATRAAAAWTPPSATRPGVADVTRSRWSAASYSLPPNNDSESLGSQIDHAPQGRRSTESANGQLPASPMRIEPHRISDATGRVPPPKTAKAAGNGVLDVTGALPQAASSSTSYSTRPVAVTQEPRKPSTNPLSVRSTSGIRRNSYAQYGIGGPQPTDLAGPQSAGGDLISGRTSASGSLMEEVIAAGEIRQQAQLQTSGLENRDSMRRQADRGQPQHAAPAQLMRKSSRMSDDAREVGAEPGMQSLRLDEKSNSSTPHRQSNQGQDHPGEQQQQQQQQQQDPPRSLPLAASLRPASSPNKVMEGASVKPDSFGNAAAVGVDVNLVPEDNRDLSFDDGTRGPLPSSSLRRPPSFDDGTRGPMPISCRSDISFDDGTRGSERPGVARGLSFDDQPNGSPNGARSSPVGVRQLQESISFDDGTRGPLHHDDRRELARNASSDGQTSGARFPVVENNSLQVQPGLLTVLPYGTSPANSRTPLLYGGTSEQVQSASSARPTPTTNVTAGGMPIENKTVGGRVRRLSRRLSGTFNALIGRKPTLEGPMTEAGRSSGAQMPQQVVARQPVPSDGLTAGQRSGPGGPQRGGLAAAAMVAAAIPVARNISSANSSYMSGTPPNIQIHEMAHKSDDSDQERRTNEHERMHFLSSADRNASLASDDLANAAADIDRQMATASSGPDSAQQRNASSAGISNHHRSVSASSTNPQDYGNASQGGRARTSDAPSESGSYRSGGRMPGGGVSNDQEDAFERRRPSYLNTGQYDSQGQTPEQQQQQRHQLLQQQADMAAASTAKEKPARGIFGRRLGRRNSKTATSLVSLNSVSERSLHLKEPFAPSTMPRSQSAASHQRMTDQAEVVAIVSKMMDPKGQIVATLLPTLERLAALTDDNDEMRSYFIATGGAPRLTQLTESSHQALKGAAARVVWHLARNPVVAMELMRAGVVPALYSVFKVNLQDPLPFIGALVHFNCHNQDLAPFTPDQIRSFIEALLIAGSSAEDALAASFCLLRIYESSKLPPLAVLKLLAGAGGAVPALVAMLGLPFCSGSEAAARLLGALSQNISAMAARIAHHGGVQGLAQLLDCPVPSGRTAAAQALAKVVAAAPGARASVIMNDVTAPLFDMLRSGDSSAAEAAAWLVGYCATDPSSRHHLTDCGVASALMPALAGEVGAGAREGAAWAADQIAQESGGIEPFAAVGACPALLGLVKTGQSLGRDSALRLLAAIGRSNETDGVTLVGTAGLKAVLPLLTAKPDQNNRAARVAAMEVVRVMCTQHGRPRGPNIELAVKEGAVKAVVAIARTGSMPGRDAAAASLAELSASGSKAAMQMLRKEKAPATLIPIMIGGSVGGREAAAVALANLAAGSKDTASEIVKAHGLVGLNQLLLSGTPSGKAAGAALVARLAPSSVFQRAESRGPLLTSLAAAVGLPSPATRIAAAEALLVMGSSNADNQQVVLRAVPALLQMLRTPDLSQVEAAGQALATMAKSPHMLPAQRIEARELASTLRAAGVVGPPTVAALDAIVAACRGTATGRPSRGVSYADYGATGAPSGYTTAARRTSYADYGQGAGGPPGVAMSFMSPFSTPGDERITARKANSGSVGGANAASASTGAPPWAQTAAFESPEGQHNDYEYSPSPSSQSGYSSQQPGGGWRQR